MNEISLTESLQQTLFRIPLFEGAPESLRASLTERLDARLYALEKNEIVAHQGTVCRVLYVLLEGRVRTDLVDEWGNRVMIETIVAPRSFATPLQPRPDAAGHFHCHHALHTAYGPTRIRLSTHQRGALPAEELPARLGQLQPLHFRPPTHTHAADRPQPLRRLPAGSPDRPRRMVHGRAQHLSTGALPLRHPPRTLERDQ